MKPKTLRIAYWTATIIFTLFLVFDGIAGLTASAMTKASMAILEYPVYLIYIVSSAKLLAAVAIIQTKFRTIKEWAFAGYAIDCLGAASSWYFVGGHLVYIVMSFVFFGVLFIPYFLWKKYLALFPVASS